MTRATSGGKPIENASTTSFVLEPCVCLRSVINDGSHTPTSAVKKAVNSTRRILDRKLHDFRIEQLQLLHRHEHAPASHQNDEDDDDDASIDRELDELSQWQDRIQAELLELDTSWSEDRTIDEANDDDDRNDGDAFFGGDCSERQSEETVKLSTNNRLSSLEIECDAGYGAFRERLLDVLQRLSFQHSDASNENIIVAVQTH
ncbi:hypothetical protein MPSEU_000623000 [Mayamaea pseudoterrestris]|nr:hypothetical protein MPSEU_000623000 [Mayamaea pseudoterrestris]